MNTKLIALAVAIPLLAAAANAGAPVICTHLDIGDAWTIPLEIDEALEPEHLAKSALKVIETSDDTLVRMETLRRAAQHFAALRDNGGAYARDMVLDELEGRILWHEKHGKDAARDWFELGYFETALVEVGFAGRMGWSAESAKEYVNPLGCLERALVCESEDPALLFGAALVSSSMGGDAAAREAMMTRAVALSADRPALRETIASGYGRASCTKTFEELLAASRNT